MEAKQVSFFISESGVFARNLKLHDLWLSGCPLFVYWCNEVDIFNVKDTVIYLSIELSVKKNKIPSCRMLLSQSPLSKYHAKS